MLYDAQPYEFLFDKPLDFGHEGWEQAFEALRHKDVFRYRVKTIRSGPVLECEIYPVWDNKGQAKEARSRAKDDWEAQRNLNDKNARKKLVRLINTNFDKKDVCVTLTYRGNPPDEKGAAKDIRNYIRRLRGECKKLGNELKYVYVIEWAEEGQKKRVHHHVILSGVDRDTAEGCWAHGWANCRRLQPDEWGLEAIARYMVKDPRGKKRWCASKNLKKPTVTVADHKVSRRQVERMAANRNDAPAIFEKLYPKHKFLDIEMTQSEYVAGAYVYVRMAAAKAQKQKGRVKRR